MRTPKLVWASTFLIILLLQGGLCLAQEPVVTEEMIVAMASRAENPSVDAAAVGMNALVKTENVQTSKTDQRSSGEIASELYEQFMSANGLTEGYNSKLDKYFYYAQKQVNKPTTSPDFGKSRMMAFDQAYQEALKQFIKSTSTDIQSKVVRSLFANTGSNAGTFDEDLSPGTSTTEALANKIIALGDATLNDKLRELGVDPAEYRATPPDKRKAILEESFVRKTVEQTSKALGGVTPIQTFIGDGGSGTQAVGVLIMYSPKLEAIASSLAREQKPHVAKQGPPLGELIPLDDQEKLYDLLGVRVMFDENGPVVVSYGQWSSNYEGTDEGMRERYLNIAYNQAETLANAQLSEFLNTSFSSMDSSEISEFVEMAKVKRGADNSIEEENANDMVDIRTEQARRRTSQRLQGASTLKRWRHKTPEGHEIVGIIKTYSFANMEAAKKTFQKPQKSKNKTDTNLSGKSSGRKSVDQMNINDF